MNFELAFGYYPGIQEYYVGHNMNLLTACITVHIFPHFRLDKVRKMDDKAKKTKTIYIQNPLAT